MGRRKGTTGEHLLEAEPSTPPSEGAGGRVRAHDTSRPLSDVGPQLNTGGLSRSRLILPTLG
jgi:hypothetical protein